MPPPLFLYKPYTPSCYCYPGGGLPGIHPCTPFLWRIRGLSLRHSRDRALALSWWTDLKVCPYPGGPPARPYLAIPAYSESPYYLAVPSSTSPGPASPASLPPGDTPSLTSLRWWQNHRYMRLACTTCGRPWPLHNSP